MQQQIENARIAVIGLGYVGLPLAVEFGSRYPTVGFDISLARVAELNLHQDSTCEVDSEDFARASQLTFSSDLADLVDCNTFIVTVPTPVNSSNQPNMSPLLAASRSIASIIKPNDVVIYESTVFPGATEEVCVPEIEHISGLRLNETFFAGYSPERINPGDKEHRITSILKVTSGSNAATATYVDELYASIVPAGTHKTSSIMVAEAAKVIENTQRDVNIALVNELSMIFERMDLDTGEVLQAAGTKWNFLPFRPGLVGGHCIGVDPYYLTHKAQALGYHPEVILAGRRVNDNMGEHIAERVIKLMARQAISPVNANVLILGLSFKENCPDLRNTKVVDLVDALASYHNNVDVFDPWVDQREAHNAYGINVVSSPEQGYYDAIVLAVAHREFIEMGYAGIVSFAKPEHILFDVKHILPIDKVTDRL